MIRRAMSWLAPVFLAGLAPAQDLPCPEIPVNTTTIQSQGIGGVAADARGNFVVVWDSYHEGSSFGVFGQRFDSSGLPQGPEFQVNTYTTDAQFNPQVAAHADGNFVVVWESRGQDGSSYGIFGRRFDGAGVAQGSEFRINTSTIGLQDEPAVGMDADGNFVVAWRDYGTAGPGSIRAQRFDAAGTPAGGEFQVNSFTAAYQYDPSVAVGAGGEFVVVWTSAHDGDGIGVFGRRFDSSGIPQGGEFQVNSTTTGYQYAARVATSESGGFVVVWMDSLRQGIGTAVFGRRYDGTGTASDAGFQLNAGTTGLQGDPEVTFDSRGGFVVAWSDALPGTLRTIVGRRFSPKGEPEAGPGFRVSTYAASFQFRPRLSATPNGGFVAAWGSDSQDGDRGGVHASVDCARLYTVSPCRVADTRDPDGASGGPALAANAIRDFPVAGLCGIPPGARAVALNATAVNPTDSGNLRFFPAGQPAPLASSINFGLGRTRASNAVIALGADGKVSVRCDMPPGSAGSTHLVLDAYGYFKR